ncbi:hypothetical protein ABZX62_04450 [Streptomyces flavidovirens]|uniref:hypothetical protein n=1 Tax=Streptomyces flavidovirens TaxID=67298 RepID=UPI0033A009B0
MTICALDLDEVGWLLTGGSPVPAPRLHDHFSELLKPPSRTTDIIVYAHGWQTKPEAAYRAADRLMALAEEQYAQRSNLYPHLTATNFAPWMVLIRWPSRSAPFLAGYRRIRNRAHTMGITGYAPRIIGQLLGYLDDNRVDPAAAPVLANRDGQFLHLVGHSFGCRLLCEAVQWASGHQHGDTLGWSHPGAPGRPFTVDSMLLLQMAAPRDAFSTTFTALSDAPLRGPIVATYAQRDWATGLWHRIAEQQAGIGNQGLGTAPEPVSNISMLPPDSAYPHAALDHWFVSVDSSRVFVKGKGPAGAHSDYLRPESAHLMLSLADYSR